MAFKLVALFKKRASKIILVILFGSLFLLILRGSYDDSEEIDQILRNLKEDQEYRTRLETIEKFYKNRQHWTTSNLGSWLFKDDVSSNVIDPQKRTFSVLIWKFWNRLKPRHLFAFGSKGNDPLEFCSVKNCIFSGSNDWLETADAVVVHLQHGIFPEVDYRPQHQRWIFLNDEAPISAFSLATKSVSLKKMANVFNWSMTFRSESDVPVPYGRTVPLNEPYLKDKHRTPLTDIIPNWKKKRRDIIAAVLMSNCHVGFRMNFIHELQKYISVDVYGACSHNQTLKQRCPGHFKLGCKVLSKYLFYLVLENSSCREYITEKIWYHAYKQGSIPIVMGPPLSDCQNLLPPNSFIHVPAPNTPKDVEKLALEMIRISEDDDAILPFHNWRYYFKALNEHGYFGTPSYHLCRVCEALNYNSPREKIYSKEDLRTFLDPKLSCKRVRMPYGIE